MPAGQAAFRLVDAEMEDFLRAVAGLDAVSGKAEADGYFTLRGESERAMIRSLAGRVALASGGGTIEGVDVPGISRQIHALSQVDALDDIAGFVERTEQSLSSGRTAIRSLAGTVRVQDGQARIDGFEVVADGGVGDVSGTADLPAWQLDLTAQFRLTEHADAPPVGIRFEGPIDAPERRYVIEDMQAHLVKLGLLSLAGASDMPKITLRKGAKAEPGTEMDELLRNVLGDPDEAEDAGPAEEPEGRKSAPARVSRPTRLTSARRTRRRAPHPHRAKSRRVSRTMPGRCWRPWTPEGSRSGQRPGERKRTRSRRRPARRRSLEQRPRRSRPGPEGPCPSPRRRRRGTGTRVSGIWSTIC